MFVSLFARAARLSSIEDPPLAEQGFAAVDALVALTILGVTLAIALGAASTARHIADVAAETRRADQVLQAALQASPVQVGESTGRVDGFLWRMTTRGAGGDRGAGAVQICQRSATARAAVGGRQYALSTAAICASPAVQ